MYPALLWHIPSHVVSQPASLVPSANLAVLQPSSTSTLSVPLTVSLRTFKTWMHVRAPRYSYAPIPPTDPRWPIAQHTRPPIFSASSPWTAVSAVSATAPRVPTFATSTSRVYKSTPRTTSAALALAHTYRYNPSHRILPQRSLSSNARAWPMRTAALFSASLSSAAAGSSSASASCDPSIVEDAAPHANKTMEQNTTNQTQLELATGADQQDPPSSEKPCKSPDSSLPPMVPKRMRLATAAVAIPHPEKVAKGGEDAYFVSDLALGVFDGVGGWASIGVDPGLYSKQLAATTARVIQEKGPACALESLTAAVDDNSAIGSSTACVVGLVHHPTEGSRPSPGLSEESANETESSDGVETSSDTACGQSTSMPIPISAQRSEKLLDSLGNDGEPSAASTSSTSELSMSTGSESDPDGDAVMPLANATESDDEADSSTLLDNRGLSDVTSASLVGVNLGDSGLIVIRDGSIVFATKEQQHYFNCPFQVGSGVGSDSVDTPQMGDAIEFQVLPGDCIVLATDGLWDNAFPHEIVATVAAQASSSDDSDLAGLQLSPAGSSSSSGKTAPMASASLSRSSSSSSSSSEGPPSPPASDSCSDSADSLDEALGNGSDHDRALRNTDSEQHRFSSSGADSLEQAHPDPGVVAKALADFALSVALDDRRQSPFAIHAQDAGHMFRGGKLDDITVVVAYITLVDDAVGLNTNEHEKNTATSSSQTVSGQ